MQIKSDHLQNYEKHYRTTFINSLAGVRQAVLIGTNSSERKSNLAIFNSIIHIGSNPPLFGFISRPEPCKEIQ